MKTYAYPALIEPGTFKATWIVTFRDVPEAVSQGKGQDKARRAGRDALGVALLAILEMERPLPKPSEPEKGEVMIKVRPDLTAKIAVIEAFNEADISQAQLAERLKKDAREVRRILDPDHATKLPTLTEALEVLGRELVIGVQELVA